MAEVTTMQSRRNRRNQKKPVSYWSNVSHQYYAKPSRPRRAMVELPEHNSDLNSALASVEDLDFFVNNMDMCKDFDLFMQLIHPVGEQPSFISGLSDHESDPDFDLGKDLEPTMEEESICLPSLLHTTPLAPRYLDYSDTAMQVFSVKIKRINGVELDENGKFRIYGYIRGQDTYRFKWEYLFKCDFENSIAMKPEEALVLTGPDQCVLGSSSSACYEFNLYVVGKGEPKGKQLCGKDIIFGLDSAQFWSNKVLTSTMEGPRGAVEFVFAALDNALQATVQIKHISGRGDGLWGRIVAHTMSYNADISRQEIVLFDSDVFNEAISYNGGLVKLWCPVLCVQKVEEGGVRLEVQLKSSRDADPDEKRVAIFSSVSTEIESRRLEFKFGDMLAEISWANLRP